MSGWPSGLRRQTQANSLSDDFDKIVFWSSIEGVGSNPTSDKTFSTLQSLRKKLSFLKNRNENNL